MRIEKHEIPADGPVYKVEQPARVSVVSNTRLTEPGSKDDIRQLVLIHHDHAVRYLEGQSVGIIVPGLGEDGRPHRPRYYSVASSRQGDDLFGTTLTLCVKRVFFQDVETGEEKAGLASSYLCDREPGDELQLIGPVGRKFLLPANDTTDLILIAVGTGIAPFRAFVHYLYRVKGSWRGRVRLFFGSRTGMESLYMNRENDDIGLYIQEETFAAFRALSGVQSDDAEHGLVQHRLIENRAEIWDILSAKNFSIYICGMKTMGDSAQRVFRDIAEEHGADWDALLKEFKAQGRWNVEVY
jgi:ferredoxin--NADP+ reductase